MIPRAERLSPEPVSPGPAETAAPAGAAGRKDEGAPAPATSGAPIIPSDVSDPARASSPDDEGLASMRAQFLADFAGGSIGRHHNTYQHRARNLRQQAGAARVRDPGSGRDGG